MKIKVLHVIGGMNRCGAETMLMNLYRKIDRDKFDFYFLVYSDEKQDYENEINSLGGTIIHISSKNIVSMFKNIYSICKNDKFDIIHVHTLFNSAIGILASKICKVPMRITHSHSAGQVQNGRLIMKIYMFISRLIIKNFSTHFFACSISAGSFLFGNDFFRDNGLVFKNGIDLDFFTINKNKQKISNKIEVGCIGSFYEVKNQQFLVCLAEWMNNNNVHDVHFNFIGEGKMKKNIKKLIEKKRLDSYFKFWGTQSEIYNILNFLDVLVMPSLYEGLPVTLVEAQACGVPCVISNRISKEVDLGLQLIEFLNINHNFEVWNTAIHNVINNHLKFEDRQLIEEKITESGYNIKDTARKLEKVYETFR